MESGEVCIVVRSVYESESLELKVAPNERISAVKSRVQRLLRSQPEPKRQRLIFCGKICADDDEIADVLGKMDVSTPQTFHLVVARSESEDREQKPQARAKEAEATVERTEENSAETAQMQQTQQMQQVEPLVFDEASVEAARLYLQTGDIAFLPVDTQIVIHNMFSDASYAGPDSGLRGDAAADAQADQAQAAANLQPARPAVRFFDFKLILRLGAVIFLFTQGDRSRCYSMIVAAVVYYVFATGIAQWLLSLVNPLPAPVPPAGVAAGAAGTGDGEGAGEAPAENVGVVRTMVNLAHGMVPTAPGILMDIFCFLSTFSLSLYPSWHVNATTS